MAHSNEIQEDGCKPFQLWKTHQNYFRLVSYLLQVFITNNLQTILHLKKSFTILLIDMNFICSSAVCFSYSPLCIYTSGGVGAAELPNVRIQLTKKKTGADFELKECQAWLC
ncbi:hypothetical protein ILYODFUR_012568 [Ilyodon furcidens]|uniref:Uncharacterized protein n=1 Tax=Ilyodon furcidens TaxID=33524 RepID=A0ABV0SLJ8_9TELE